MLSMLDNWAYIEFSLDDEYSIVFAVISMSFSINYWVQTKMLLVNFLYMHIKIIIVR